MTYPNVAVVAPANEHLFSSTRDVNAVDDLVVPLMATESLPRLCVPAGYRCVC